MRKVELHEQNICIDDQAFLVRGAEIQYFRLDPEYWDSVLKNACDSGINLVTTYIPWYFHEEEEGFIDLDGHTHPSKNLRRFFELACKYGLYIAARPGPFINSELRNGGFPNWLFEKYPQTLSHNASGRQCPGRPCPAEGEPLYREKVFHWYNSVIPVIAEFQDREKGGVILFQPDNELSSAWSFGLLNSLYDPDIINVYWPQYLQEQYSTVDILSRHYESRYSLFTEVLPPRAFPSTKTEVKTAIDWMNFKRCFFADWGIELTRYAMSLGIHVPTTLNEPVAGFFNHGDHSGVGARIQKSGLPIFTSCHTYSDRIQDWDGCTDNVMSIRLNRSSPLNSVSLAMEAGAGCYNERLRKSDLNWDMLLRNNLMDGLAGSVIYSYSNGTSPLAETIEGPEYWPLAPVSAEGRTSLLNEKIKVFHQFVSAWESEIASAYCSDELNLAFTPGMRLTDFFGTYPLMGHDTAPTPGGERFNAEPKIDRGETALNHDWLDGYEGVSKQTVKAESSAWRRVREALVLSVRLGITGRMIDLVHPCCSSDINTPLIVANSGCLEEDAFHYLRRYIRGGGTVIFTPMIPQFDLYGNPNHSLLELLGAELTEMIRPAGNSILDYGGRVIQTPDGSEFVTNSWISLYKYRLKSKPLAFYQDKTAASVISLRKGKVIVAGFEAFYNNSQSAIFWQNIFKQECNINPAASSEHGYFSLFSRKSSQMHFLAAGNAAGTFEPDTIHCADCVFDLELNPQECRILIFHAPILNGSNQIRYCTSEVIPHNSARSELELHGSPGSNGKIVFEKNCTVHLNGSSVSLSPEDNGFSLYYEHTKNPLLLSVSK